jgi:hypothetical protein
MQPAQAAAVWPLVCENAVQLPAVQRTTKAVHPYSSPTGQSHCQLWPASGQGAGEGTPTRQSVPTGPPRNSAVGDLVLNSHFPNTAARSEATKDRLPHSCAVLLRPQ